jgi:uncharacterized membrane protein YqjE
VAEPKLERPAGGERGPGAVVNALELLSAAWRYLHARLELAGMEGREAAAIYLKSLGLLLGGIVVLVFGYLFFCLGAVFAIATAFGGGQAWIWVTLAAAFLHFVGGGLLLWKVRSLVRQPVFDTPLEEFRRDHSWLNASIGKNN